MTNLEFSLENNSLLYGFLSILITTIGFLWTRVWRNFNAKVALSEKLVRLIDAKLDKNSSKSQATFENLKLKSAEHAIQIAELKNYNLAITKQLGQIQKSLLELSKLIANLKK